jgi:hypothetical protein
VFGFERLEGRRLLALGDPVSPLDGNDQVSEASTIAIGASLGIYESISMTGDVDMYRFRAYAGSRIGFDIDQQWPGEADLVLRIFDQSGVQLISNDDALNQGPAPEVSIVDPYIDWTFAAAGDYYVGVSSYPNSAYDPISGAGDVEGSLGGYNLILYPFEANDTLPTATAIGIGGTIEGALHFPEDVNLYAFDVPDNFTVFFDIDRISGDHDTAFRLFDALGNELAANDDGYDLGPLPESNIWDPLLGYDFAVGGTYYLGVSNNWSMLYNPLSGVGDVPSPYWQGEYQLHVNGWYDRDDQLAEAVPIEIGATRLIDVEPYLDVDMFSFSVSSPAFVRFDVDSTLGQSGDLRFRVFDASGAELSNSDDGLNQGPFPETLGTDPYAIVWLANPGVYYVGLSHLFTYNYDPVTGANSAAFFQWSNFGQTAFAELTLFHPKPGDATGDDKVDGADYTVWADYFLSDSATWLMGDFTGDGVVDGADYTVWADHYEPLAELATRELTAASVAADPATADRVAVQLGTNARDREPVRLSAWVVQAIREALVDRQDDRVRAFDEIYSREGVEFASVAIVRRAGRSGTRR